MKSGPLGFSPITEYGIYFFEYGMRALIDQVLEEIVADSYIFTRYRILGTKDKSGTLTRQKRLTASRTF